MKKTIVIYGSTTGTCESIANDIAASLGAECISASSLTPEVIADHDDLILGTSTWGAGDMQDDWYDALKTLQAADLSDKTIALFGCGDSCSYSDTFCGGMAEIYGTVKAAGAKIVGAVDASGYTFDDSAAVEDGKFVGLALDNDNEDNLTPQRIEAWIADIKPSL